MKKPNLRCLLLPVILCGICAGLAEAKAETDAITAPGRGGVGLEYGSVGFSFIPTTNLTLTRVGYVYAAGVNPVLKFWAGTNYTIATYSLLPGAEQGVAVYTNAAMTLLAGHLYTITLQEGPEATNAVVFYGHAIYGGGFQVAPELIYRGGCFNPQGVFGVPDTNVYGGGPAFSYAIQSTPIPLPSLSLTRNDMSTAVISWPAGDAAFVLEQASSVLVTNWALVTNAVNVADGTNRVVVSPVTNSRFYRLMHP